MVEPTREPTAGEHRRAEQAVRPRGPEHSSAHPAVKTTDEARQARTGVPVLNVLLLSTIGALVALALIYFLFMTPRVATQPSSSTSVPSPSATIGAPVKSAPMPAPAPAAQQAPTLDPSRANPIVPTPSSPTTTSVPKEAPTTTNPPAEAQPRTDTQPAAPPNRPN